jgi:hypothetical protein
VCIKGVNTEHGKNLEPRQETQTQKDVYLPTTRRELAVIKFTLGPQKCPINRHFSQKSIFLDAFLTVWKCHSYANLIRHGPLDLFRWVKNFQLLTELLLEMDGNVIVGLGI